MKNETTKNEGNERGALAGLISVGLLLVVIGMIIGKCSSDKCATMPSAYDTERSINAEVVARMKAMDDVERAYGVEFPSFPFEDIQACKMGEDSSEYDILELRAIMEKYDVGGMLRQWYFSDDYSHQQFRVAIKVSSNTVLYLASSHGSNMKELLSLLTAKMCEVTDKKCMNQIANNFME